MNTFSVAELARLCAQECEHFQHNRAYNDRYGRELFARAIIHRNDDAWAYIYEIFKPIIASWIVRHSSWPKLARDGLDPLINGALAKYAVAMKPENFENFPTLSSLLAYLRLCVFSVISDEMRDRESHQPYESSLQLAQFDLAIDERSPECETLPALAAQDIWQIVRPELHDDGEYTVFLLVIVQRTKPALVASRYRRLFSSVEDIYRIRRNVLERLRRNQKLKNALMAVIASGQGELCYR